MSEIGETHASRRRKWLLPVVVVGVAAVLVFGSYVEYQRSCGLACNSIPVPTIEGARIATNIGGYPCSIMPGIAVCAVDSDGATGGTIDLNVTNAGRVQFLIYSSEPGYITFTSTPPCTYAQYFGGDTTSCQVNATMTTFSFGFNLTKDYAAPGLPSITLLMRQTCCFP